MPGGNNPSPPSALLESLQQDAPVIQDADYEFDTEDRAYIDAQILAIQQLILQALLLNLNATWFTLDGSSAQVAAGQPVCAAANENVSVTLATDAALAAAGGCKGVAITGAAPGAKILVAQSGLLPASLTGLAQGSAGPVKATAGALEQVATIGAGDYPVGYVNAQGVLTLGPILPATLTTTSIGRTVVDAAGGTTTLTQQGDIDVFANSTASTANHVDLPTSPSNGQRVRVCDVGNNAAVKNITLDGGSKTVSVLGSSGTTYAITTNGGSQDVEYSGTQGKWFGV